MPHDIIMRHHMAILDSIFDGILIIDTESTVIYVNPEYLRIARIKASDILGKPLRSVRPGAMLPDVVKNGRPVEGAYRCEGAVEYVADMSPIIHDNKIVGGISVVKGITEVQRLAKDLGNFRRNNKQLRRGIRQSNAARYTFNDIIYAGQAMEETIRLARTMAAVQADLFITGESGTGKEVFAQAIHNASARAGGPFLPLNCATLSPQMIESELFGYADGAFTGAKRGGKAGFFEVAEGGTLFLDEVTELSVGAQAKLLRVLEERTVRRVGETSEIPTNIRVIAASNRDIGELITKKCFRNDLYYRLSALRLELPPLRGRSQDVLILARMFFSRFTGLTKESIELPEDAARAMLCYPWPGNIRELRNIMEYSARLGARGSISAACLPTHILAFLPENEGVQTSPQKFDPAAKHPAGPGLTLAHAVSEAEKAAILVSLRSHGASLAAKKQAAKELGISLTTLYSKIAQYGLQDSKILPR